MDVGLVCSGCKAFNDITSAECTRCMNVLSLRPLTPNAPEETYDQRCAHCGAPTGNGTTSCAACDQGTPSSAASQDTPVIPPFPNPARGVKLGKQTLLFSSVQVAKAKLVLIKGEGNDGESYALAGENHHLGSGDADILFGEDPFLSSTHANFFYSEGRLILEDCDSANGVYLRIRGTSRMQHQDHFLIGEQILQVRLLPDPPVLIPEEDGTYFYSSPDYHEGFELQQFMQGGVPGLVHRAQNDVVTLGRDSNDINFPNDPFLSGRHAHVSIAANHSLLLSDMSSKNGTFIRITQKTPLEHGDYVFMGQQLLRVEIV